MYPTEITPSEEEISRLTKVYLQTYKEIVDEIEGATDFGVANRKHLLSQIDAHLEKLGVEAQKVIEVEIPAQYKSGADDAVMQLKNTDAPIRVGSGFSKIHEQAIQALVSDTAKAFGESLTGVSRSADQIINKATKQEITMRLASGQIKGEALREVKKTVIGTLQQQGLYALQDKAGRAWTLDRYSEMLIRTKSVEARNRGLMNRIVENNYDLVQVSSHGATDACGQWEGDILSVTGANSGYSTLSDAESSGLFHPNCKHAINAVKPELAGQLRTYDPNNKAYYFNGGSIKKPIQKVLDKSILEPSRKFHATFQQKMTDVATEGGWKFQVADVKGKVRAVDKIVMDYNGDIYKLKDAQRSVILISNPNSKKEIQSALQAIEGSFGKPYDVKNKLDLPTGSYRAVNINVNLPDNIIGEVQLTTPEMWRAKIDLGGDQMYNIVRAGKDLDGKVQVRMEKLYSEADNLTKARLSKL